MLKQNNGGILRSVGEFSVNNGGVIRNLSSLKTNDGGVIREVFSSSVKLGNLNVGDIVKIKENGVDVNYIIVHKGKPSNLYDDSCDGVWLLRENIVATRVFNPDGADTRNNDYENSEVHSWLNNEYINTIDPAIRSAIKNVKIPFVKGDGNSGIGVYTGANGLLCKTFLLSAYEVGFTVSDYGTTSAPSTNALPEEDGAKLSFFTNNPSRVAKNINDVSFNWWLRSPNVKNRTYVAGVTTYGWCNFYTCNKNGNDIAVRPAFILPHDFKI